MDRFNRVIVAVDVSAYDYGDDAPDDRTRLALDSGAWLARGADAELRLVAAKYLAVTIEPAWRHEAGPHDRPVVRKMLARLQKLAEAPRRAGIKTSVEVRVGNPLEQLLESATMWDADLLVVGGARRTGALGLLGSTSSRVFLKAPCSVWIARKRADHEFRDALVALNVDDNPQGVLEIAASFASAVDSRLHVLGVVEEENASRLALVRDSLTEWTESCKSRVRFGTIEALVGEPGETILEQAARRDAEIVFIGPSRRSAVAAFLGARPTGAALKGLTCSLVCARSD